MQVREYLRTVIIVGLSGVLTLSGWIRPVEAQYALTIEGGSNLGSEVRLDSSGPVEAIVLAISFASSPIPLEVEELEAAGVVLAAGAELVVPEIFPAGFTLGVVLDAEFPFDDQTITPGVDQLVATFRLTPTLGFPSAETEVPLEFVDGVLGDPTPLTNRVIVGGLSIEAANGLTLNDGTLTVPAFGLTIIGGSSPSNPPQIRMSNSCPVEGFVLSIAVDSPQFGVQVVSPEVAGVALAVGAEFVESQIYPQGLIMETGFTLGVVLDFEPPFDGQTVPTGADNLIATFGLAPTGGFPGSLNPTVDPIQLEFVDGGFGILTNCVIVDSIAIGAADGLGLIGDTTILEDGEDTPFARGDCSADGAYNFGDLIAGLSCVFMGEIPMCEDACDANDSGDLSLTDPMKIANDLFAGGTKPPKPNNCGEGSEWPQDGLSCVAGCP